MPESIMGTFSPLDAMNLATAVSTAAPDETAEGVRDVDRVFRMLRNFALLLVCGLLLMVLFAYRKIWGAALYEKTLGQFRVPGIRDVRCGPIWIGPVLGVCCGKPWTHFPFRTRLAIRSAYGMRSGTDAISKIIGNQASNIHVSVKCGLNPPKTTSSASPDKDGLVTWNEPVDLDVTASDDFIFFEICGSNGKAIVSGQLDVTDIWIDGTWTELRNAGVGHRADLEVALETVRGKAAGVLVMDALIIPEGEKFLRAAPPPLPPGAGGYQPLSS